MRTFVCTICGYVYNESVGIPEAGITPGTKWEDLPDDWVCPLCGASKSDFQEKDPATMQTRTAEPDNNGEMRELSSGELSALFSNLAKGCEKQYLPRESGLFNQLSEYYRGKVTPVDDLKSDGLQALMQSDLKEGYPVANTTAGADADRGALRALVWGEKVTKVLTSLLRRYEKEGDAFLENTNVYVCEICGFIYIGKEPPQICPVCKVPSMKIMQMQRRA